jgi:gluconokinase
MNITTVSAEAAEAPLILTIDIGSSSARALLYDRGGRMVEGIGARARYEILTTTAGAAEVDPGWIVEQAARCVDIVLVKAGKLAQQIAAVAIDTLVTSIVAVDAAGQALTPLITYADTRNAEDAAALRARLDEAAIHDRTGCLLRTSYWPARLAWFRRTQPELWRRTAKWLTLGEYLELRLFGRCRVSYSAASWSGLLDRRRLAWDAPLLAELGLTPEQLSLLVDCDAPLSGLIQPYAGRWPLLHDVAWFPAIGDGAAANVGSGCIDHQRMALTLGTTGAIRVIQTELTPTPPGLWSYRVDRDHHLVGGATSEGGNVYAWVRDAFQFGDRAQTEAELAALAPDSHGLTILPFFAGERSPDWAGNVQATIHGLTLATTPLQILRASLEAVAYRFAVIEQRLCGRPDCDHRLIASGGALLQSPVWSQIFADVLGRPVVVSAESEATSRGAALLALRALGALPSLAAAPAADGAVYLPDPARHERYQVAIARQRALYEQVILHRNGAEL